MENLQIIEQKIKLYGDIDNCEHASELYFKGLGYEVYYSKSSGLIFTLKKKYKKLKELIKIFEEESLTGIPDLLCLKNNKFLFVEVKRLSVNRPKGDYRYSPNLPDNLSHNQLNWINSHPNVEIIVFYLSLELEESKDKEIEELKENLKFLNTDNKQLKDRNYDLIEQINLLKKSNSSLESFKHNFLIETSRNLKADFTNAIDKIMEDVRKIDNKQGEITNETN